MTKTIYFIRHGESDANAGARTSDEQSICLTKKGWEQAGTVKKQLLNKVSRIIASPYRRARDTATPLSQATGLSIETWPIEEFLYLDPAQCAGTSQAERSDLREHYWGLLDPEWRQSPNTESFSDLLRRVEFCRDEMEKLGDAGGNDEGRKPNDEAGDGTAIFGHGLFGMALLVTLHFPEEGHRGRMERLHRLVYVEGRNLRNGQILVFTCARGRLSDLPAIP